LRRVGGVCVRAGSATTDHWACLLRALTRVDRITQRPQRDGGNQDKPKAWGLDRIAIARFKLVSTVCVELHQARTRMLDVRSSRSSVL
jgi:hypothetical protein